MTNRSFQVIMGGMAATGEGMPAAGLKGGGGDGTSDGMEPRLARLESDVSHLARDVGELRHDMRDVRDRVTRIEERMATKAGTFVAAGGIIAAIAAFTTFQDQIRTLLGIG